MQIHLSWDAYIEAKQYFEISLQWLLTSLKILNTHLLFFKVESIFKIEFNAYGSLEALQEDTYGFQSVL